MANQNYDIEKLFREQLQIHETETINSLDNEMKEKIADWSVKGASIMSSAAVNSTESTIGSLLFNIKTISIIAIIGGLLLATFWFVGRDNKKEELKQRILAEKKEDIKSQNKQIIDFNKQNISVSKTADEMQITRETDGGIPDAKWNTESYDSKDFTSKTTLNKSNQNKKVSKNSNNKNYYTLETPEQRNELDLVFLLPKYQKLDAVYKPISLKKDKLKLRAPSHSRMRKEEIQRPDYSLSLTAHWMPFLFRNQLNNTFVQNDSVIDFQIKLNPKISYELGLGFRFQKRDTPWFVSLGFNYLMMKEQIDLYFQQKYIDHNQSYWQYDSVYYYYINPPIIDSVLAYVDSAYNEHIIDKENRAINKNIYKYLEIPILFGYHKTKLNSRFSWYISTGVSIGWLHKSDGYFYNQIGDVISYDEVVVKHQINWYYLLNLGINYQIDKLNLFIEPSLKFQLNKEERDNDAVQYKYFIYGAKFGVRFTLF